MEIEVKDLKKGDEILVGSQSGLRYCIVLKDPVYDTVKNEFKKIKLSANVDGKQVIRHYTGGSYQPDGSYVKTPKTYTYTEKFCHLTPEGHNKIEYKDLNHKKLWLIERKEETWI